MDKKALNDLKHDDWPKVYRKEHRQERIYRERCWHCEARTCYADFAARHNRNTLLFRGFIRWQRDELYDFKYEPSPEEAEAADRDYEQMERQALFTIGSTQTRKHVHKTMDAQGKPYWNVIEVHTTDLWQICETCFQMEPALAEAVDECRRFCRISVIERCQCGRTKPVRLGYCVPCQREWRMLELRFAVAKQNRRLIAQLKEALRNGATKT